MTMPHTPTDHDRILRAARSHFNIKPHTDDPYYASVIYEHGQYWLKLIDKENAELIYSVVPAKEYGSTDFYGFELLSSDIDDN